MNLLDRKRRLELAGITAWAERELTIGPMHVGQLLLEQHWGPYQRTVERVLQALEGLRAAIGTLEKEIAPAAPGMGEPLPIEVERSDLVGSVRSVNDSVANGQPHAEGRSLLPRFFSDCA